MRIFDILSLAPLSFRAVAASARFLAALALQAGQSDDDATGTQLKRSVRVAEPKRADSLRFYVSIENVSEYDTVLNLGLMLGNGKILQPEALRLLVTAADGQVKELHFSDKKHPG